MFHFAVAAVAVVILAPGLVTALHLGLMATASVFFRAPTWKGDAPRVRFLVVIPAHNEELLLGRTLEAINADKRGDDQVLVVDDRSTDRTGEIAREHGAVVLTRVEGEEPGRAPARQAAIRRSAEMEWDAMVMVDDSHAVGFVGAHGRGSPEHCRVEGRVDIITGTLGKALGGASGGYTSARRPVVDWLRQRSRPYLFSNTLAPVIAAASLEVFDIVERGGGLRTRLYDNAARFREKMKKAGFTLAGAGHPIIPVMIGDAALAQAMAAKMLERGIYVIAFSYPVVPKGQARIRTQMSAAHSFDDIDRAVETFADVGREVGVIS